MPINPIKFAIGGFVALLSLIFFFMAFYTVPEGHVGIVKTWSRADYQVDPGLHFKTPIMQDVEIIEVRQRRSVESLSAATANQLSLTAEVSVNWTVNKEAAMDLFVEYGSLESFEARILAPKIRSAGKAALSRFQADTLIRERQKAVGEIFREITAAMEGFPVRIDSPQLENIVLPPQYLEAILQKEQAREAASREQYLLEKQKLEAERDVQSADASKRAEILRAEGKAASVKLQAEAEAEAIRMVNEQLSKSPLYIDLQKAKTWNGVLPQTVVGGDASLLMSLK